jgi:drug/metabolite transporter (DMT)-like permease
MIWVAATLIAALAQTGRNAAQAGLTERIGTFGATAVRFIFGLPFAALALLLGFAALGAAAQILATAFMLMTMRGQSFGVATALMKTEPVTLALIGALVLAEPLGPARLGAIGLATLGVVLASGAGWSRTSGKAVLTGILAGALFGLSAIGFRGAILALPSGDHALRALTVLVLTLTLQSAVMLVWLAMTQRATLRAIWQDWPVSLLAGALGAFASLFWFIGFALTPAANVRTLALVEVFFAQIVSGKLFRQTARPIQLAGMAMIVAGVIWLLWIAA